MVTVYCDLLDVYVKVRGLFTNKEGKQSCKSASSWSLCNLGWLLTIQDAQGFRLFFRVAWEPFEEQFQSIEATFVDHINIIVRLANVEHQILSKEEDQDNQRWSHVYICHNISAHTRYR